MSAFSRTTRVIAAAGLVLASSGLVASPARAATVDFGRPSIEGSFDSGVTAKQPVTLDGAVDRIEVLVTLADSPGPLVSEIDVPSTSGATTLSHRLGGPDAHILPNTPVRVRWRITVDGAVRTGPEARTVIADERFDWKTIKGDVVRVHWYDGDRAFGERALRIGEREVEETAKLFGVTETEPVDFFIYADRDAFYDALGPGTRANVGGQANAEIRTLFADIAPSAIDDPWVDNVVPHELVHLIFDTAVQNPNHFPPRWLNEGLATYLSVGLDAGDRAAVESAAESGALIPLGGLVAQFPTGDGFGLAYSESVSAVDFLVRTHGQDTLVSMIRSYADGKTDDEAFEGAIGMDVAAFNQAWLADIGAKEPVKYGPQPAAPGPRPSDWGATPSQPPVEPAPTATPLVSVDVPLQRGDASLGLAVALLVIAGAVGLLVMTRRSGASR